MKHRRHWQRVVVAAVLALAFVPGISFGFPENTETQGEIPADLNAVWLVVSHLEFARPTPQPTPEAPQAAAEVEASATGEAAGGTAGDAAPGGDAAPAVSATAVPEVSPSSAAEAPGESEPAAAAAAPQRNYNVATLWKIIHLPKPEAQRVRDAEAKMEQASVEKAKALIAEEQKEQKQSIPLETESGEVKGAPKVLVPTVPPKRQPGDGDDVDIFLLDIEFPKTIQDSLEKAQKAEKPWLPSAKELALLKSSWGRLKPSKRDEYSKIEWKVVAADKFDEGLQMDAATKDAKFAITSDQDMIPKPGVPNKLILVFGAREIGDGIIEGGHVRAMMASAPFPIPIEMKGKFMMYKVTELPKPQTTKAAAKKK